MDKRTRPAATDLFSSTDEKFHQGRHENDASTSMSSSSSTPRRANNDDFFSRTPTDFFDDEDADIATASSPAYPSFFSRSHQIHHHKISKHKALNRLCYSVSGGPARRRAVLGLASLVLMSLLFWGFGVHTMLLEEREKYLYGVGYSTKQGGVPEDKTAGFRPPVDALPTTGLDGEESDGSDAKEYSEVFGGLSMTSTESPEHAVSSEQVPAVGLPESGPITADVEDVVAGGKLALTGAAEHDNVGENDGGHVSQSIHTPDTHAASVVPTLALDEFGHNRPASNDSDFCTTWPVDRTTGKYSPKPIPASQRHKLTSYAPQGGWKKPPGLKVVAMVFYGRKRNVDILDCYLQQNLARNGGYLDEVRFMVKTTNEDDVEWLRAFVKNIEGYAFQDLDLCTTEHGYGCIWEYADEDDTLYLKIDDDILFIHPDAIPQLVHTRLAVPEPFAVSAQLVNSPIAGLQQYHYGAIHPFIPDPHSHPTRPAAEEWRPSKWGTLTAGMKAATEGADREAKSPYNGHPGCS